MIELENHVPPKCYKHCVEYIYQTYNAFACNFLEGALHSRPLERFYWSWEDFFSYSWLEAKIHFSVCGCGGSAKKKNPIKSNGLRTLSPATIHVSWKTEYMFAYLFFTFRRGLIFWLCVETNFPLKKENLQFPFAGLILMGLLISVSIFYSHFLIYYTDFYEEILMNLFRTEDSLNCKMRIRNDM